MLSKNYQRKIIPVSWCNFLTDYPDIFDSIYSLDKKPIMNLGKQNVAPKQPLTILKQSFNRVDKEIQIPEELRELYLMYRPTPLCRAVRLEKRLNCNTKIYYKYEGNNISGSHKLNTALAQAYFYKKAGVEHVVTGTGAGQWGTAIAYACKLFGLQCTIFMVDISLRQKPQRASLMKMFGATVYSSPSTETDVGKKALLQDQKRMGSLSIASAEAIEMSNRTEKTQFAIGSGENCVLLHQTIIGNEAINQIEDEQATFPDYIFACMGAGSNFAGIGLPFLRKMAEIGNACHLVAVEPVACPKLTKGIYAYEVNDFSGSTPISKMYTLGNDFIVPGIHAGGLRYHGTSEFLSGMYYNGLFFACSLGQLEAMQAAALFFESEGLLVAPESAYAIGGAIKYINEKRMPLENKTVLINISGNGFFDFAAYQDFNSGNLNDEYPDPVSIKESIDKLKEKNKF